MESIKIYGAQIVDLALQIDDYLIIADLHLGYEEDLNRKGIMIPRFQYRQIKERLEQIARYTNSEKIIINGDLKHEFGRISRQERKEVSGFIDFLQDMFQEIILIKGNHDNFMPFIDHNSQMNIVEEVSLDNYLIIHGDRIPADSLLKEAEVLIIGHEHPCIGIRSMERVEKLKSFLGGEFKDKKLIVMPSFNFISEGSDVLQEKPLTPFLKSVSVDDFNVYGVENFEIFPFGKIKQLRDFDFLDFRTI